MYPRVDVRSGIVGMIARKCNMTSFPNTLDVKFIKLKEKAHHSVQGNKEAAENIWRDPDRCCCRTWAVSWCTLPSCPA